MDLKIIIERAKREAANFGIQNSDAIEAIVTKAIGPALEEAYKDGMDAVINGPSAEMRAKVEAENLVPLVMYAKREDADEVIVAFHTALPGAVMRKVER